MTGQVAVLRPEPGNARTVARAEAMGLSAMRLPLFAYRALAWEAPEPSRFDALLLTSAAAPRLAGKAIARLRALPVVAVGPATATAAAHIGLSVAAEGSGGVDAALAIARARGFRRLLHLTGRDRVPDHAGVTAVAVYASVLLPVTIPPLDGVVALLHSARAAARFAELMAPERRAAVALAAISDAVLAAAGPGWARAAAAPSPSDDALLRLARSLVAGPAD